MSARTSILYKAKDRLLGSVYEEISEILSRGSIKSVLTVLAALMSLGGFLPGNGRFSYVQQLCSVLTRRCSSQIHPKSWYL
jgi:hypothetical protein